MTGSPRPARGERSRRARRARTAARRDANGAAIDSVAMALPETLERLLTAPGPSGQEELASQVWRDAARTFGEVSGDVLGSSWVPGPGTGEAPLVGGGRPVDEIAVVVTHIGDDGLLAIRQLGGFDPRTVVAQRVELLTREGRVPGVVGARKHKVKRGDDTKPYEFGDLFIDIGARNGEEARTVVRPGDAAIIAGGPLELRNNRLASRSLDNRLGSYVALEVARRVAEAGGARGDVVGVAAVQEEVGDFAGSRTIAYELEPAVAIAVDVTHATDVRGADPEDEGEHNLGGGPALMRGPAMHPRIFDLLYETAEAEGIRVSVEVSRGHTNTDADAMYLSRVGVATGLVSIPLRYMHTPVEVVQLDDVENVIRLIVAFAQRLEPGISFAR